MVLQDPRGAMARAVAPTKKPFLRAGWLAGWAGWLAGWLGWLAGLAGWLAGWLDGLAGCWLAAWKLETLFLNSHTLDALKGSADLRILSTVPSGNLASS